MSSRDWRSSAAYDDLDEMSLRGLAWEYLRRNPDYVANYHEIATTPNDTEKIDQVTKSWGLRFRGRPIPVGDGCTRLLGVGIDIGADGSTTPWGSLREDDAPPQMAVGAG
jgi:hypothetical protein